MSKCGVIKCHGQSCPSSEESDTDEPWTRGQTTSQLSQVSGSRRRVSRQNSRRRSISGGRRSDTDSCGNEEDSRCHPDCDTSQTWYSKLRNSVNGSWLSFKKYLGINLGVNNCADLYNLLYYKFYNDRYRWELFKSILWFSIGIKLFSDIRRHLMSGASDGSEIDGVDGLGGAAGAFGGGTAGALGGGAASALGGGAGSNKAYGSKGFGGAGSGGYDGDGGGADTSDGGGWGAKIKRLCKPKKPVIEPC